MSKDIKTITKILIIIIMAISILLILPSKSSAVFNRKLGTDDSGATITTDKLEEGKHLEGDWNGPDDTILNNKYVYCCWKGQKLRDEKTFEVYRDLYMDKDGRMYVYKKANYQKETEISVKNDFTGYKFCLGLFYIFSRSDTTESSDETYYNSKQLALWAYLQNDNIRNKDLYKDGTELIFNFEKPYKTLTISRDGKYIEYNSIKDFKAYEIYKDAISILNCSYSGYSENEIIDDIRSSNDLEDVYGSIYKLHAVNHKDDIQQLLVDDVSRYKEKPKPEVEVKIKKVTFDKQGPDNKRQGLANAQIKVTKWNKDGNVKKIKGLGENNIAISGSNGFFDTITVVPKELNEAGTGGVFSLCVQELVAPSGYSVNTGELRVQVYFDYDKSTKKATVNHIDLNENQNSSWSNGMCKEMDNHVVQLRNKPGDDQKTEIHTSDLLVRKTGINWSPLGGTRFAINISNLNDSSWGNVYFGDTQLTLDGEWPDWYNESDAVNDDELRWHYGRDADGKLCLMVFATSSSSADHESNSNTIYLHGLDFIDKDTRIDYSVREIRVASGGSNYYYQRYNGGRASDNFAFASWQESSNNQYTYDKYGNGLAVNWYSGISCEVYDFHNEPIYYTNFALSKIGLGKSFSPAKVDVTFSNVLVDYDNVPKFSAPNSNVVYEIRGEGVTDHNGRTLYDSATVSEDGHILKIEGMSLDCYDEEVYSIVQHLAFWKKDEPIIVKIEEKEAPKASGYYYNPYYGSMEFKINVSDTNSNKTFEKNIRDKYGNEFNAYYDDGDGYVKMDIFNNPYIRLNGWVWEDGQTGDKNAKAPDGMPNYSNEKGIKGVSVQLLNSNNSVVKNTSTGNDKEYKSSVYYLYNYSFEDVPVFKKSSGGGYDRTNKESYRVRFTYDGITYIETISNKVSSGDESIKDMLGTMGYSDASEYNISIGGDKYGRTFKVWDNSLREDFNDKRKLVTIGSCFSVYPVGGCGYDHSSISGNNSLIKFRYKNATKSNEKQVSNLKYDIDVEGRNGDSRNGIRFWYAGNYS